MNAVLSEISKKWVADALSLQTQGIPCNTSAAMSLVYCATELMLLNGDTVSPGGLMSIAKSIGAPDGWAMSLLPAKGVDAPFGWVEKGNWQSAKPRCGFGSQDGKIFKFSLTTEDGVTHRFLLSRSDAQWLSDTLNTALEDHTLPTIQSLNSSGSPSNDGSPQEGQAL